MTYEYVQIADKFIKLAILSSYYQEYNLNIFVAYTQ